MSTLGQTIALCPVCRKTVPAKVVAEAGETRLREATPGKLPAVHGARPSRPPTEPPEPVAGEVHFISFCPEHGEHKRLVRRDVAAYLQAQRNVKPAWIPRETSGKSDVPCPEGCGICDRHEQHLCLPIIEITNRCDLSCPICLVDAGEEEPPDPRPERPA